MRSLGPAALACVLLASAYPAAIGAQPVPAPAPQSAPATASPAPVPVPPTAAPLPAPSASPSATPSPEPAPTATPSASPYHYVVTPPSPAPGQPVILEIDLLERTLHPGQPYSVRVRTSLDVATLSVTAMGQTYGMQSAGPGLFASDGQVPGFIPFFMLGRDYTVTIVAQTADKKSTTVSLSLRLER